jgi:hypothetical protein
MPYQRNLIYIECSLEFVHILAAKTVVLKSGAKTGAPKLFTSSFLGALWFDFV